MQPLATFLKQSGLRQIDLARRSSIRPAVICDVLKGRREHFSPDAARKIVDVFADVLGVDAIGGLYEKLAGLQLPRHMQRRSRKAARP